MPTLPYISVAIPVFNAARGIAETIQRTLRALEETEGPLEVIVVDDGATDDTASVVEALISDDPRVKLLSLSRSFGFQNAISAGLQASKGRNVAVVDADLEDPPELIPDMIHILDRGSDVVYGVRENRKETLAKRIAYRAYYRILSLLSETPAPRDTGDFCVMRRRVVEQLNSMPERGRYVRGMRSWVGFKQTAFPYDRLLRNYGSSKHGWRTLFRLASRGVVSSSRVPLTLSIYAGVGLALTGFIWAAKVVYVRLVYDTAPEGFSALMVALLTIGGVQLIAIGMVGMYLARVLDQTEARPNYIVARHIDRAADRSSEPA